MEMTVSSKLPLTSGAEIPVLGFGVWKARPGETKQAVLWALEAGYRHIDTAAMYYNEEPVGEAIRESGIPREEIFVTTKLWNDFQTNHTEMKGFEDSLDRLGLDYVDMYMLHWAVPGCYTQSWGVLEQIYKSGRAKSIGVCNCKVHHMEELMKTCEIAPHVNQMEFNPGMQDYDILRFCQKNQIVLEAWSPLGSGTLLRDERIAAIGAKYGKSVAQTILRWLTQKGIVPLVKSVNRERILENRDIFDFVLSEEDCKALDAMNTFTRSSGLDPDSPPMVPFEKGKPRS